ncbi:hypothetical protein EA748_00325 [Acinetobacter ursingii]|nr:hypothetical protein EA748_00325 [Acinetobacter ursingii]
MTSFKTKQKTCTNCKQFRKKVIRRNPCKHMCRFVGQSVTSEIAMITLKRCSYIRYEAISIILTLGELKNQSLTPM